MRKFIWVCQIWLCFAILTPTMAHAMKIVVDAGHGGSDPGAIGINGLQEKVVTLDIAQKLKTELLKRGNAVILTREDNRYMSLQERVDFTNRQSADLFISIHGNDYPQSKPKGTLVLYYDNQYPQSSYPASNEMKSLTPSSKTLAQKVLDSFVSELHTENQGIVPSSVYVVRRGTIPSILVETAFLSNASDAALLADPAARTRMAIAIANGIAAYQPSELRDIAGHWAQEAIMRLYDKGIVVGDDHLYYPNRAITRAELLTLLNRAHPFAEPESAIADPQALFADLDAKHWAFPIVTKAYAAGFIRGFDDGTIKPDQAITRGEAAALIDQFMKNNADSPLATEAGGSSDGNAGDAGDSSDTSSNSGIFSDVPDGAWYSSAINHLQEIGLIAGKTSNLFEPNQPLSRAEFASILDRLTNKP